MATIFTRIDNLDNLDALQAMRDDEHCRLVNTINRANAGEIHSDLNRYVTRKLALIAYIDTRMDYLRNTHRAALKYAGTFA